MGPESRRVPSAPRGQQSLRESVGCHEDKGLQPREPPGCSVWWGPRASHPGGLGSRPGRPGSDEDQCKSPNSSRGPGRGHTETLAQNQPQDLGASAAADGSQDPVADQTQTREPRVSSSLDRVPLPPLDKNFGERGDPVCCSRDCNHWQGNLASTWFREKL
ncbi:unnamed protein product [Rangifer tarandus platyrhynchus]|uniref:Uncharacterized protein n=1 Tax=Rangifer tarandus platyrhynchus TaxID=3082113 RepID=A0ACB1MKB7_RANTA